MQIKLYHTILVLTACLAVAGSCQRVIIPKEQFAAIMVEMFLVDQQIQNEYSLTQMADTTLLYAAVLHQYGYTMDDFLRSLNRHIRNPEKFKKVLQQQRTLLLAQKTVLQHSTEGTTKLDSIWISSSLLLRLWPDSTWSPVTFFERLQQIDTVPPFRFVPYSTTTYPDSCSSTTLYLAPFIADD